jgi:hypothetical protein
MLANSRPWARRTSAHLGVTFAAVWGIAIHSSNAAQGPQFKSARALSMGNAFVALADTRDALHYNPAGLNLINRNASTTWRDRVDARLTVVGLHAPREEARDGWGLYSQEESAPDIFPLPDPEPGLEEGPMVTDVAAYRALEFAVHNFGIAYSGEARVERFVDYGLLLPQVGTNVKTEIVLQAAFAGDVLGGRLSWGAGPRLVKRRDLTTFVSSLDSDWEQSAWDGSSYGVRHEARDQLWTAMTQPGTSSWGLGLDVGLLWQQTSWLRLGVAAQNVGLSLEGDRVTPEVTAGLAATIPVLSSRGSWGRTVNVAVDYEDALNDDLHTLSKVNFGAELNQSLGRVLGAGAGGGFKGGYWTAGARVSLADIVHLELVSWAEEGGAYPGDFELRRYAINLSAGI